MPFVNAKQEMAMKINAPKVWKEWVKKYGHAPGFKSLESTAAKKAAKTRKKRSKRKTVRGGGRRRN
jgi:hypothetical protein